VRGLAAAFENESSVIAVSGGTRCPQHVFFWPIEPSALRATRSTFVAPV
jgi:hypothetical protein